MKCKETEQLILKYFDSNLDEDQNLLFEKHLKSCKECDERFQLMYDFIGKDAEFDIYEPSEGFEQTVMKRIDAQSNKESNLSIVFTLMYNCAAIVSTLFILIFALGRGVVLDSIISIWNNPQQVINVLTFVANTVGDVFSVIQTVYQFSVSIISIVIEAFYLLFIGAATVFIVLHRLFNNGYFTKSGEQV